MMAFEIRLLFACIFLFTLALPVLSHRNLERVERSSPSPFDFLKKLQGCHKGEKIKGLHNLKTYLEKFGYLNHDDHSNYSNSDDFDETLESAIKTYQVNYNLKPTGTLDAETVSEMMTPRCGVPDIINGTTRMHTAHYDINGSISINIVSNFTFFPGSPRWPQTRLTYAFEANTPSEAFDPVGRAFSAWDQATRFSFQRVPNTAGANLVIGFHRRDHGDGAPFDGPGGTIAHAFAPTIGRFHYDADERYSVGAQNGAYDLQTIAVHEIGHLLGLGHSSDQNAIMFPTIAPGVIKGLGKDDIDGITALYGS